MHALISRALGRILGLAMFAAAGITATPASADDVATCTAAQSEPNARLQACERMIATGKSRGRALAPVYTQRGFAYHALGEYDRAIAEYSEAIRLDPKVAADYFHRGSSYLEKKDYDRAIADFDQALRLDPKLAIAYARRGIAYRRKQEYDRSIADFDQAIRLAPNTALYYDGRATAYVFKADYDRAIADYDQAIRLDPTVALFFYARGVAHEGKRDFDRAIADYDQAIRLNPKDINAHIRRGDVHASKRDYDRAIADYDQAIRLDPNSALAYNRRDGIYRARQAAPAVAPSPVPALAGAAAATQAAPVLALFEKHGLIGTFAADCTKSVSPQNAYVIFRALDAGRIQYDWMIEPAKSTALAIVSANELGPNEIKVRAVSGERHVEAIYKVEAKRHRMLQSIRDNGETIIVDGRAAKTGAEMPWMNKCG